MLPALSVRFEVGVSRWLAPAGADERGPKAPFPLVEIAGIQPAIRKRVPAGAPAGARSYWKHWLLVWTSSNSGGIPTSSKHFSQKSCPWFTVCSDLSLYMFYSCKISHYGWELNCDCIKRNMDPLDFYRDWQSLTTIGLQLLPLGCDSFWITVGYAPPPTDHLHDVSRQQLIG